MSTEIFHDKRYEENVFAYFNEQLPEKLYDAHFHTTKKHAAANGYEDPYLEYADFMEKSLGRKMAGGLIMTNPSGRHTPEALREANDDICQIAKERGLSVGYMIAPWNTKEEIATVLNEHPEVTALKPYLCYADVEDQFETDIATYTPEWAFELADEYKLAVLIHLSHYKDMLLDESNLRDLRYFSKKYPNAKIVLAHCGMGHHVRKLRLALPKIADLENIWFDCSGVSETMSIYYCVKALGVEKMMWGGDHSFAEHLGRVCSYGSNFLGLHPGILKDALPPDYKYQPLSNSVECTLALLEAMEVLGLSKKEREDIFYNNAASLYGR